MLIILSLILCKVFICTKFCSQYYTRTYRLGTLKHAILQVLIGLSSFKRQLRFKNVASWVGVILWLMSVEQWKLTCTFLFLLYFAHITTFNGQLPYKYNKKYIDPPGPCWQRRFISFGDGVRTSFCLSIRVRILNKLMTGYTAGPGGSH